MLVVLSPSKTLDLASPLPPFARSTEVPRLFAETRRLLPRLRGLSEADLQMLMDISPKLAAFNMRRFAEFSPRCTPENARPAIYAFKGDVYEGFDISRFDADAPARAQASVRILSGLYGLLRPLDLIQPYRLEMGTRLENERGANLYAFWGNRISRLLNDDLAARGEDVLVNLASQEYFAAVDRKALKGSVLTPVFKEKRGNRLSVTGLFAKKARGAMAAHIALHDLRDPRELRGFGELGYGFREDLSTRDEMVFVR